MSLFPFCYYLIARILFPRRYLFFLVISILCEFYEIYIASYNSKWLIDSIFNMLGYWIGDMIEPLIFKK